jgi:hypothetical protein
LAVSRHDAPAITATGYAGVAAGGALRSHAYARASAERKAHDLKQHRLPIHNMADMKASPLRRGLRTKFGAGTALALASSPAAIAGTHALMAHRREPVARPERTPAQFIRTGVHGAEGVFREKTHNARQSTPNKVRASSYLLGAGAGAAGSQLVHGGLNVARHYGHDASPRVRGALTVAGGTAAVASSLSTMSNINRRVTGYEITPTGVKRAKTKPVRPSTKADTIDARHPSAQTRSQIVTKDDYLGRHISPDRQRASMYAAGAVPVVGAFTEAGLSGKYAPPGEKHRAEARQLGYGPLAGTAAGVAGAYTGAGLAGHSRRASNLAMSAHHKITGLQGKAGETKDKVKLKLKRPDVGGAAEPGRFAARVGSVKSKLAESKLAKPLISSPERAAGALLGYHSAKIITGETGRVHATTRNLADERAYNASHPMPVLKSNWVIRKLASDPGMTRQQTIRQLDSRQHMNNLGLVGAVAGTAGVGLGLSRAAVPVVPKSKFKEKLVAHSPELERAGLYTALGAGGVSAYRGIRSYPVERRDLNAKRKALNVQPHETASKALLPTRIAPAGAFKRRVYAQSYLRRTMGGGMTRVRAGVR